MSFEVNSNPRGRAESQAGFTMVEMIVVLAVMAILLMMSVPAYIRMVPYQEIRSDAKTVTAALQRARMMAANTQKPTRVLLDCTDATRKVGGELRPCRLQTQLALFDSTGAITGWHTVSSGNTELHASVHAVYAGTPNKMVQFDLFKNFFKQFETVAGDPAEYGTETPSATPPEAGRSFVVAFLPGGEAVTAWAPLAIEFVSRQFNYDRARLSWLLSIGNSTGRLSLKRNS